MKRRKKWTRQNATLESIRKVSATHRTHCDYFQTLDCTCWGLLRDVLLDRVTKLESECAGLELMLAEGAEADNG